MKFLIKHIEILLEQLARKTKQSLDQRGFENMGEVISDKMKTPISERYLYETLFLKARDEKKKGHESMTLQAHKVNKLAEFLGYEAYEDFVGELENPLPVILQKCIGVYGAYIRRNTDKGVVLFSPVEITEKERKTKWVLKGPIRDYKGEVEFKNNCLFVLMKGESGKQFHHVYQIGQRERPDVLQGIFSGVSTAFEPIGGRVVLIRADQKFDDLKVFSSSIADLKKSKSLQDRRLAEYFSDYSDNNLALRKSMTFSLDDLGDCR
jgi:hypothetical protein